LVLFGLLGRPALAQTSVCPGELIPVAQVISEQGHGSLVSPVRGTVAAQLNAHLCAGTVLRTEARSRMALRLQDSSTVLRVDQNTQVSVRAGTGSAEVVIELFEGAIHFLSRVPRALEIHTPYVNAGVKGTEFVLRVSPISGVPPTAQLRRAYMTLFEGSVGLDNSSGAMGLTAVAGEPMSAMAPAGGEPRPYHPVLVVDGREIRVQARDTVQWTLYYPPAFAGPSDAASAGLREAAELLSVGRVDEAKPILDRARANPPQSADALALLSVILVTQNANVEAEALARDAVARDPGATSPRIALSYALQAQAKLREARDVMLAAAAAHPNDALVWSRLAELHLALGYRDRALDAAEEARAAAERTGAAPEERARTLTILGFAALTGYDRDRAEAAFREAIALDSANPLPRLGLGLVKINRGDLVGGRREIEIAVVLDPGNSLMRSYLGKAYFEGNRDRIAEGQFDMAMGLDPADPTPWLYDAILKQATNRPVDALALLQGSIARNDNRAVYRSRLDLDEDLAARGTALAWSFEDLGFDQLALVEGTRSVDTDPADHSAHRFLSDTYAALPRHEIARASELLRSQLLQPVTINPVPPEIAENDLLIRNAPGPANPGFNEFTPLFQGDGAQAFGSGFVGNNDTYGDEAVVSGQYDRIALSAGQYHYQSDGFRANNDLKHDIYDAFAQVALTDELDVQFEYRHRETEHGDLRLNFDPENFSRVARRDIEQETFRGGAHYAPAPHSDFLFSLIYSDRDEMLSDEDQSVLIDESLENKGYDGQAQYIFRSRHLDLTAGGGASHIDVSDVNTLDFNALPPPARPCPPMVEDCTLVFPGGDPIDMYNLYGYANIAWPDDSLIWALGFSYDNVEQGQLDIDKLNPKAGLQWRVNDHITLRAAYIETVKRPLVVEQTLEPTQVAGFNQFFDDFNGTKATRYGGAVDVMFTDNLWGGVEYSRRELEKPSMGAAGDIIIEHQDEALLLAYLYWAIDSDWAARAEVRYEQFDRNDPFPEPLDRVTGIDTLSVPVAVSYFHPSGFFAEAGATYVHQSIDPSPLSTFADDEDDYVLVDAAVGYRLPKQLGVISLEVHNLFDEHFLYQDEDIQNAVTTAPLRYTPERTVLGRLTLTY
jgi:tetratricopeptide (TPR) repeat protein